MVSLHSDLNRESPAYKAGALTIMLQRHIGMVGFEPTAAASQTQSSPKLSYIPNLKSLQHPGRIRTSIAISTESIASNAQAGSRTIQLFRTG